MSARPSRVEAETSRRSASEPWTPRAVVRLLEVTIGSLIVMGVAWYGCGGTVSLNHQVLWLVLGMGAGLVGCFGQAMFVLDAIRAVRERRLAVMTDIAALLAYYEQQSETVANEELRLAAPAMVHFHRPSCQLVAGKPTPLRAPAGEHLAAGRSACGVCAA